jgi:alpha-tubulin suppressor-like RCC1 family protein
VYTYHSGTSYGLFSGALSPTKTGRWSLYSISGTVNIVYETPVIVSAGPIVSGQISFGANIIVPPSSNTITINNLVDRYNNPVANASITLTGTYSGPVGGYTPSSYSLATDAAGDVQTFITSDVFQNAGTITYAIRGTSIAASFTVFIDNNKKVASPESGSGYYTTIYGTPSGAFAYGASLSSISGTNTTSLTGYNKILMSSNNLTQSLSTISNVTLFIDQTNHVWSIPQFSAFPVEVSQLNNIVSVVASNILGYSYALDNQGNVWQFNATSPTNPNATLVTVLPANIKSIEGTYENVYALDSNGNVWAWGYNEFGQLGIPNNSSFYTLPGKINGLTNIIQISAFGSGGCYALNKNGQVYAWGDNSVYELGNGTNYSNYGYVPTIISGLSSITSIGSYDGGGTAIDSNGNLWGWGYVIGETATKLNLATTPEKLDTGSAASGVIDITSSNTIQTYAGYQSGQQHYDMSEPMNTYFANATIANLPAMAYATGNGNLGFGISQAGELYVWGDSYDSGLGDGVTYTQVNNIVSPEKVANPHYIIEVGATEYDTLYALDNNGYLYGLAQQNCGQLPANYDATTQTNGATTPWTRIATGVTDMACDPGYATVGVIINGEVYLSGYDESGQVQTTPTEWVTSWTPCPIPSGNDAYQIQIAGQTIGVLDTNGNVYTWGDGHDGALGNGTTQTVQLSPVMASGLSGIVQLVAYNNDSYYNSGFMALKKDGTVWGWGFAGGGYSTTPREITGITAPVSALLNSIGYIVDTQGGIWSNNSSNFVASKFASYPGAIGGGMAYPTQTSTTPYVAIWNDQGNVRYNPFTTNVSSPSGVTIIYSK